MLSNVVAGRGPGWQREPLALDPVDLAVGVAPGVAELDSVGAPVELRVRVVGVIAGGDGAVAVEAEAAVGQLATRPRVVLRHGQGGKRDDLMDHRRDGRAGRRGQGVGAPELEGVERLGAPRGEGRDHAALAEDVDQVVARVGRVVGGGVAVGIARAAQRRDIAVAVDERGQAGGVSGQLLGQALRQARHLRPARFIPRDAQQRGEAPGDAPDADEQDAHRHQDLDQGHTPASLSPASYPARNPHDTPPSYAFACPLLILTHVDDQRKLVWGAAPIGAGVTAGARTALRRWRPGSSSAG